MHVELVDIETCINLHQKFKVQPKPDLCIDTLNTMYLYQFRRSLSSERIQYFKRSERDAMS